MVLPIALLVAGVVLILSGVRNESITDLITGATSSDTSLTDPTDTSTTSVPSPLLGAKVKAQTIDGFPVAGWIANIVLWARANGWTGTVTSGIRSDAAQRQACINVCGNPNGCAGTCAKPGTSNHRLQVFPGGAVDVTNPAQFALVLSKYPGGAPIKNALPNDLGHFSRNGN